MMIRALLDPSRRDTDLAEAGAMLLAYGLLDLHDLAHAHG